MVAPVHAGTLFEYTGPAVAIPDDNPVGITVTIPVSGLATSIGDVDVVFRLPSPGAPCTGTPGDANAAISHTFTGDLEIDVRSPAGTTVSVMNDAAGSHDNVCALALDDDGGDPEIQTLASFDQRPLQGHYRPSNPLSVFDGENPNGIWTITIRDDAGADTGTLRRIGLQFERVERRTQVIRGTLFSDTPATMTNRITRNGVASDCDDKAYPGVFAVAGNYQYKLHTITNPSPRRACIPVSLQVDDITCAANVGIMAYGAAFNPSNLAANYIGDSGSATGIPPQAVVVQAVPLDAGASGTIVVYASQDGLTPYTNCPYHLNVGGPYTVFDIGYE